MKLMPGNDLEKYIIKNKKELCFYIVQMNCAYKINTYGFIRSDPFLFIVVSPVLGLNSFFIFLKENTLFS